jgi:LysR family hydrogen peroxide-inducible transcriptional activator
MEMHQLRYAVAVARAGNFSRAAEQCHVSQPSLSQQIQKLEHELGERLFDRLRRAARLTPEGEAFVRHAVHILEEVDAATREASESRALLRGVLSVGVLPTIAPYLLPGLLSRFEKKHPGVEILVHEDMTANLIKQLFAFEIDFAVASEPLHDRRLAVRLLQTEELLLALPRRHRLAKKRTISASDLEQERFIVMKEGHCLGDQVLEFCNRRDLRANVGFRSAQLETIQALVHAGMGLSLIPSMAAEPGRRGRPDYRSLAPPRPVRRIVAAWPRQRPPGRAASELLRMASENLSTRGRQG